MTDIIERLEAVTCDVDTLDEAIATFIGLKHRSRRDSRGRSKGREWFLDSHSGIETWGRCPPYTTSIDAALTLVPEGWQWNIDNGIHCEDAAHAWLGNNSPQEIVPGTSGDAATPALALCIAALKARTNG